MIIRMFLLVGVLLAPSAASAQSKPVTVKTELVTIALTETVDGLFYFDGKTAQPFTANLTGIGQPFDYEGPQRFVVRANAAEFSAPPPLPPPAASVLLPLRCSRVLLACIKPPDKALRIAAYDISTKDRAGDYRFFNFSDRPLSLILDGRKLALAPGKDASLTSAKWRDAVLDLPVQVAAVEKDKPKLVYSSVWGHRPGRRNFVFMFKGSHPSKPVTFCRFFDIPPAVKAE